jgi:hypothetical protein
VAQCCSIYTIPGQSSPNGLHATQHCMQHVFWKVRERSMGTCLMHRTPSASPSSSTPLSGSSSTGTTPKNGIEADPGLSNQAPGRGVIMWPPVSVCMHTKSSYKAFGTAQSRAQSRACTKLLARACTELSVQCMPHSQGPWYVRSNLCSQKVDKERHLPPGVNNRASASPDDFVVPPPRLRVDRLAHCAKNLHRIAHVRCPDRPLFWSMHGVEQLAEELHKPRLRRGNITAQKQTVHETNCRRVRVLQAPPI